MFGLSLGHILILFVVVLLFGANRLPELGGALGKGLRAFRKGLEGPLDDDEEKKKKIDGKDDAKDGEKPSKD
ncbi:MAG TPA: twin-arginine translocase TatA/TatE family subunit [Bdellovibrionota bacterium]|nr:twin-arginine translocase TatA/TatE family subunit [Bdellovibrionota bacterium]